MGKFWFLFRRRVTFSCKIFSVFKFPRDEQSLCRVCFMGSLNEEEHRQVEDFWTVFSRLCTVCSSLDSLKEAGKCCKFRWKVSSLFKLGLRKQSFFKIMLVLFWFPNANVQMEVFSVLSLKNGAEFCWWSRWVMRKEVSGKGCECFLEGGIRRCCLNIKLLKERWRQAKNPNVGVWRQGKKHKASGRSVDRLVSHARSMWGPFSKT